MFRSPTIALDSGFVDLNDAIGMNLEDKDQIHYRKRTTCAILPLEGYTKFANAFVIIGWKALRRPVLSNEYFTCYLHGLDDKDFTFAQSLDKANIS